jgi:non-specific serine/threonine protein kinase
LLGDPAVRLVTLTGPGGVGKTRLAVAIGAELANQAAFPDGIDFVALAPIGDPKLVAPAIAQALGIRQSGAGSPAAQIIALLRDARLLLVLDNLEHLLPTASIVAELLSACPRLTVLATSRERLHLSGEHAFPVSPLTLPAVTVRTAAEAASAPAAVRLFVQRASEKKNEFVLSDAQAAAIVAICTRLDGLPLAIELAASRVDVLSPQALLARLDSRLPLLTESPRNAPSRHRTMRDAIAWSYDLLPPEEQVLFRRLAVFAGGCTIEAADAVAGGATLDAIASLVGKSLLHRTIGPNGTPRFAMLETIREFAAEQPAASGEAAAVRAAHAAWMLALTEEAAPRFAPVLQTPEAAAWLSRLEAERDNLQAALTWLEAADRWHDLLRLAAAAIFFWDIHLQSREGRVWLERALDPSRTGDAPLDLRARAMLGLGIQILRLDDNAAAEAALAEAHAAYLSLGRTAEAAVALRKLGAAAEYRGDDELAAVRYATALDLFRTVDDTVGIAATLDCLADLAYRRSDYNQAGWLAEESMTAARAGGSPLRLASALITFGEIASARGDLAAALTALQEALRLAVDLGYDIAILGAFAGLADVAARAGMAERAAQLLGAATALVDAHGLKPPPHHALFRRADEATTAMLGEAAFRAAWNAGRALPLEQAIAAALDPTALPVAPPPASLTPREAEILPMLVAGQADREIAGVLCLSVRTVENHVARLTAKLGVRSRHEVAAVARAAGLLAAGAE